MLGLMPPPPPGTEPNPTGQMLQMVGMLIMLGFLLASFGFWLWMIIDCVTKESGNEQIGWALLIILICCLGAGIYFFVRKIPRDRRLTKNV